MLRIVLSDATRMASDEAEYCERKALVYQRIASLTPESPEYVYALTVIDAMHRYHSLRRISANGLRQMLERNYKYRQIERPFDMRAYGEAHRVIMKMLKIDYPNVAWSWYYEELDLDKILLQIVEAQFGSRSHMYIP